MLYTGSHRYQFAKDMYFSSLPLQQSYAQVVPKFTFSNEANYTIRY